MNIIIKQVLSSGWKEEKPETQEEARSRFNPVTDPVIALSHWLGALTLCGSATRLMKLVLSLVP